MDNEGIGSWTARRARKTPGRVAVVHGETRLTYADLHERVCRLAHALRGLGVRRGDRVAYLGPNHPAFLETLFAAGMLGAVFVPLNMRLAGPELEHCLTDSGTGVLVHAPEHAAVAAEAAGAVRHRVALAGPGQGAAGYEDLLAASPAEPVDEAVRLDDPCLIMYTSGTTGRPKGAVLTHGNITWNSVNVLVDIDLAADEVTLVVAPLFHTAGLNMTCLPTLLKGGTVVLMPAFDPAAALAAIEAHRVTYMFGVPVMFDAMAACPAWPSADLSSLRQLNCGGSPVPPSTIRTYQDRGLAFSQGYGMTEASPGVLYLAREDAARKAGTAGVPHFFTDVRVVDPELRDVAPGEKGEVLVSGPNVMRGYWGLPAETARTMAAGWFRSGDVATVDADGYVAIVDRVKDMIISGGENVYPAEVEAVLYEHPDVAECAVIGVPDERWGEVGRAVVVPRPGADPKEPDLIAFLQTRLAKYKVPKTVVFTTELPRNPTGKILKKVLRATHARPKENP
ncbi:acyl-CoA synthetase [Actinomadura macrotermitis]|uniref:Long-chain-fatty-acid--CoA ligase FadD13 n=1 Tax=Actinomadura macrotermitis TaxID=2585200 RepID=A0A7K0C7L7_9ACTN|nr:long-chain fatty acid--CoA ligase [Actinomadura macrotermitis]MQY09450.1 Long-chain-fatty-acid--CoA ligase FadD13 [Actinomadura macrotermitis]